MAPLRNHNHHTYAGVGLKKGPWSAAEDAILIDYVRKHGDGNWNELQRNTSLQRCGKSCRLRWTNHLRPNLKKGAFSPDEERLIVDLHSKLGNKWARISSHLPGRTDNEVKNYWNTRVKRRLRHGLPLYPNQQQHQSHSPSISPPPPPSLSPPILKTPTTTIPTPFLFNPNTQLPFLTGGSGTPCFDPNTWPSSDLGFLIDPDLDMTQLISETHPFGSVSSSDLPKLELPSNQFRSHDDAAQPAAEFEAKVNYPNLLFTNPSTRNSGLLDSLLLESRYRAARAIGNSSSTTSNNNPKKEKVEGFDQFNAPTYMDECLCGDGGVEIKKENVDEDDQHKSSNSSMMNEDLSSIFKQISSSPPPDEWCDCCQEPAAAASEEEDIYNVNIAEEFDQMPPLIHQNHSPPAADQPDWFDDTNGILSLLGMNNSKDKFFTSC